MLATENTEIFSFVGAASAANSSRSDGLFAAEAAPTFTVVQIKTTIQAFDSVPLWLNVYRINPLSLVKTQSFYMRVLVKRKKSVTPSCLQ